MNAIQICLILESSVEFDEDIGHTKTIEIPSSYLPSTEVHLEYSLYWSFISNHKIDEQKLVRCSTYLALGLFLKQTLTSDVDPCRNCVD